MAESEIMIDYVRVEQKRRLYLELRVDKTTIPDGIMEGLKEEHIDYRDADGKQNFNAMKQMQWKEEKEGGKTYVLLRCVLTKPNSPAIKKIRPLLTGDARLAYIDGMRMEAVDVLRTMSIDSLEVDVSPLDAKAGEKLKNIIGTSCVRTCSIRTNKFYIDDQANFLSEVSNMLTSPVRIECPWSMSNEEDNRRKRVNPDWPLLS